MSYCVSTCLTSCLPPHRIRIFVSFLSFFTASFSFVNTCHKITDKIWRRERDSGMRGVGDWGLGQCWGRVGVGLEMGGLGGDIWAENINTVNLCLPYTKVDTVDLYHPFSWMHLNFNKCSPNSGDLALSRLLSSKPISTHRTTPKGTWDTYRKRHFGPVYIKGACSDFLISISWVIVCVHI